MFWRFPGTFTSDNSAGIRPRSSYLKVIGDFTRWNNRLVFGCDDSAQKEFLNKRKQKGGIEGPGQSNSNLWFTSVEKPDSLGPNTASGSVWLNEEVVANQASEPYLFAGWEKRCAWIQNSGNIEIEFVFEIDKNGNQIWKELQTIYVEAGETEFVKFSEEETGEWIRVTSKTNTTATVSFNYTDIDERQISPANIFKGLATVEENNTIGGLMYGLGNNRRALGISAMNFENGLLTETGFYELDAALNLLPKDDDETNSFIKEKFAIPGSVIEIEQSSVLIVDDQNRRWRLPLGNNSYKKLTDHAQLRICREVATERDLLNCSGTFYELPAENADGFAKIRPVASHNFRIHDYASYRGMLVISGLNPDVKAGDHIVRSDDGKAAVWVGVIDDLWEMGKPRGHGGPWKNSVAKAGVPSDAYLIGFYDKRSLEISHDSDKPVTFKIEVEPIGHGPWMVYKEITIQPGKLISNLILSYIKIFIVSSYKRQKIFGFGVQLSIDKEAHFLLFLVINTSQMIPCAGINSTKAHSQVGPLLGLNPLGIFKIEILEEGDYTISLSRYPRESGLAFEDKVAAVEPNFELDNGMPASKPLNITEAKLSIAQYDVKSQVKGSDKEVAFDLHLQKGKYDLDAHFINDDMVKYPPYYIYIELR